MKEVVRQHLHRHEVWDQILTSKLVADQMQELVEAQLRELLKGDLNQNDWSQVEWNQAGWNQLEWN